MKAIGMGLAILGITLGLTGRATAEARPATIPPLKGAASPLKMNVIGYRGGSNGELTVEVLNPSAGAAEFSAQGLYFVPDENANNAPQRLGAVGPFRVHAAGNWQAQQRIAVPASGAVKLKLDVYCIDSHRRSPATGDRFHLAGARIPPRLTQEISVKADQAASAHGGYASPAAKSAVQSEIWKARDKKWQKLEGEGAQEATK